jgi:hypothetical protein
MLLIYSLACGLFNDAVTNSDNTASTGRISE